MRRGVFYFILLLLAVFVMGFYTTAKCAYADHWNQNASLTPGKYLIVYRSIDQTAQLHAMYEYFDMMGIERVTNLEWTGFAAMFNIDDIMTTEKFVKFLNTEPVTTLEAAPMLFRLVDDVWLTVPLPCQWLRGDTAM